MTKSKDNTFLKLDEIGSKSKVYIILFSVFSSLIFITNIITIILLSSSRDKVSELENDIKRKDELIHDLTTDSDDILDDANLTGDDSADKTSDGVEDDDTSESIDFNDQDVVNGFKNIDSEYLGVQTPSNWSVRATTSKDTDLDSDDQTEVVDQIIIVNANGDEATLTYIPGFGVTQIIPVSFGEDEDLSSVYMSTGPNEDMGLSIARSMSLGGLDCSTNEAESYVYCDAQGVDYVESGDLRYLLLDEGVVIVVEDETSGVWTLNDGVKHQYSGYYYSLGFEGDWSKSEIEELVKVLESIDISV